MAYRDMKIASVATVAVMAGAAAIVLQRVPAGTMLPTHFTLAGVPDRFSIAAEALFWPVGLAAFLSLVMASLPALEPLRDRLAGSATLYRVGWGGLLAMMTFIEAMTIAIALGGRVPIAAPLAGVGVLLIVIGNALPKSRPNFFVGIKTPWTLTDTDTWIATHRLGGKLSVVAGLVFLAIALVPLSEQARMAAIWASVALLMIPLPYSYLYWRRRHRHTA